MKHIKYSIILCLLLLSNDANAQTKNEINKFIINPKANSFDLRKLGWNPPARNQGTCSSCWAFSAAAAMEVSYFLKTKKIIDLSEQHIINCFDSGGCSGGFEGGVFEKMVKKNEKILPEKSIPYQMKQMECGLSDTKIGYRAINYIYISFNKADTILKSRVDSIKRCIAKYGSVSTTLVPNDAFINLKTDTSVIKSNNEKYTVTLKFVHAVLIIGWDDAKQSWLIRNSWGEHWGNKGYAWVKYDQLEIGMDNYCIEAGVIPSPTEYINVFKLKIDSSKITYFLPDESWIYAELSININNKVYNYNYDKKDENILDVILKEGVYNYKITGKILKYNYTTKNNELINILSFGKLFKKNKKTYIEMPITKKLLNNTYYIKLEEKN